MATKPTIDEIIAKAVSASVVASQQAQPKPEKRPFFSPKSPGLWASVGAIAVYAFTILGNINGCFQTRYDKDHKINYSYDGVNRLDHGDSVMLKMITQNYWSLFTLIRTNDSLGNARHRDTMDSLYDHRIVIDSKKNK